MNTSKLIFFPVLLALFVFGSRCSAQPTKAQMIADLRTVFELLSKGDNMAAVAYFKGPETKSEEDLAHELNRIIANQELTMTGIEILEQHGNFGTLSEIFPERYQYWLERVGLTTAEGCYAMGFAGAEVAAYWNGKQFQVFRLDDIGQLRVPK